MRRTFVRGILLPAGLLLAASACSDATPTAPGEAASMRPPLCGGPTASVGCPGAAAIDSARTLAEDALGIAHLGPGGAELAAERDRLRRLADALAARDVTLARTLLRDAHAAALSLVADAERRASEDWPDLIVLLLSLEQVGRHLNDGAS